MSSWSELLSEANKLANPIEYLDAKRKELLQAINKKTDRNIITYYSAWLTKPNIANLHIVDGDKNAIMGKESSLGPVDPQFHGLSCQEAVDEFEQAVAEVSVNPASLGLWQIRISKYTPTFLVSCKNAIDWSKSYTQNWLARNYKLDEAAAKDMSKPFVEHSESKSHSRHISVEQCKTIGLNIIDLEKDNDLQDLILSLHHAYMIFFDKSTAFKAVENQIGARYLRVHDANGVQ